MKQCPVCKTTYTDDSLSFCLSDGASLLPTVDEEQTVVRKIPPEQLRIDLSNSAEPMAAVRGNTETSGSSSIVPKIVVATIVILVLVLGALGLAGTVIYYSSARPTATPLPSTPTPLPNEENTLDPENERLRDEIANIRRKLEERERIELSNNRTDVDDEEKNDPVETATVNSPNDGFLALRTHPSTQVGDRIARIPHGAKIEVLDCSKSMVVVEGRRGSWCEVEYRGQVGWVFDAWLNM